MVDTATAKQAASREDDSDTEADEEVVDPEGTGRSPKIQALLDAIGEMKSDEKGVIYSQW
jgi:hypothetical protein